MQTIGAALERVQAPYFADYTYTLPEAEVLKKQQNTNWENPVKFSVVVPAYETKEEFLSVVIESLLQQTYPHWELLLVDDCSQDNSRQLIEEYGKRDSRIHLITKKKNAGAAQARNTGVQQARGRYLAFLDADDVWLPRKLELELETDASTLGGWGMEQTEKVPAPGDHFCWEGWEKDCSCTGAIALSGSPVPDGNFYQYRFI